MSGRQKRRVVLYLAGGVLLSAVLVTVAKSWRVTRAVAVIDACGGGISDDEIWPYFTGPRLVTFDLPGIQPTVKDSDASRLARAFSNFSQLRRLTFDNTPLGDEFFTTIAPSVAVDRIDLSYTRCSDAGVRALIQHRSARWLQFDGLTLSDDTRKRLSDTGMDRVSKYDEGDFAPSNLVPPMPASTTSPPSRR